MNGKFEIHSEKNIGTRVKFSILLEISDKLQTLSLSNNQTDHQEASIKSSDFNQMLENYLVSNSLQVFQVLIVEDNDINVSVLKHFLKKISHGKIKCDIAKNGRIAFEMFQKSPYRVVFMDLVCCFFFFV